MHGLRALGFSWRFRKVSSGHRLATSVAPELLRDADAVEIRANRAGATYKASVRVVRWPGWPRVHICVCESPLPLCSQMCQSTTNSGWTLTTLRAKMVA